MNLTQEEINKFYKLWYTLVWGINEKHKVIPHFKKPKYGTRVPVSLEEFMEVRNAMWDNPTWIDEFLLENDNGEFTEKERGIITRWRKDFLKDDFLVVKHLRKYTVIMTFSGEHIYLYGVHGISDPLEKCLPYPVPFPVNLVLLPWEDRIIYDSLAATSNVSFGAGLRSAVKEMYDESKGKYGIIEALGVGNPVVHLPKRKKNESIVQISSTNNGVLSRVNVPKAMEEKYNEIAEMLTRFSNEKLNDEYRELLLKGLAKLCRKRPSPLVKGKAGTWACGIAYAIGSNNFIFDKSQEINMTATEIAGWFGISKTTASNKASEIRNLLHISPMDAEYSLKSFIDENPAMWLFDINGYIIDIRTASYEVQKYAYERGWIPYIPDDKK